MKAPARDNWDDHWEHYAAAASRNPAQQMRHRLVARLLQRDTSGGEQRVFDIGSGQGDLLMKLQRELPRARFLGVELSEHGVEISRRKAPGATLLVADLFHPPTELARYQDWGTDAVCSEVLEHVDDPAGLLRAARVYLADGARLIVTVPGGPMSAFDRHIGHRQHFTRESIRQVLHDAGFVVERVCLAGFPFFNLYRLMVIARGERLSSDVDATHNGATATLANAMMAVFRGLLRITLLDSPFGWQVLAIARKAPVAAPGSPQPRTR